MRRFRFVDHAGDIGIEAFGSDLNELFRHAAEAFTEVVTDLQTVQPRQTEDVVLQSESEEELLVRWLNELVFLFDAKGLLFSAFDVLSIDDCRLKATIRGETYDPARHPIKTTVKAATHHRLRIVEKEGIWMACIILDL